LEEVQILGHAVVSGDLGGSNCGVVEI